MDDNYLGKHFNRDAKDGTDITSRINKQNKNNN